MSAEPRGEIAGILLVDKPAGPTSHDVVAAIRKALGVRRVGHAGTLDPGATGLLVLCVGAATKLVPYLQGCDKTYEASFVLGVATDTGDGDGTPIASAIVDAVLGPAIRDAVLGLRGELSLCPPAYSAIHVDGRRAHELARAGLAPELAPRSMVVRAVSEPEVVAGEGRAAVHATWTVSKGTYVRSLAEELGRRLGLPCHLGRLRRTAAGELSLRDPRRLEGLSAGPCERREGRLEVRGLEAERILRSLLPPAEAVPFSAVRLGADEPGRAILGRLARGQAVPCTTPGWPGPEVGGPLAVVGSGGGLWVVRVENGLVRPERLVLPEAVPPATA